MATLIIARAEAAFFALLAVSALAFCQDAGAIGRTTQIAIGTRLSAGPGTPADRVAMGSPALIVDVKESGGVRWYRLIAADGTNGWTSQRLQLPAVARIPGPVDALDQSPDSDSEDGPKTIRLPAPVVTGASSKSTTSSPQHLMLPLEGNWLQTPLLRLNSGDKTTGWASPYEVRIEGAAAPRGLVRALFVRQKPVASPMPRQLVPRVDEDGETVSPAKTGYMEAWPRQEAEFAGELGASLAIVPGGDSHLMRITRRGAHRFLIFDKYKPLLRAVAHEDWTGDGVKEWLVEVIQLTGDGHRVVLWVIFDSATQGIKACPLELGASSGESGETVTGSVVRDRKLARLWIVQSDTKTTSARLVRFSSGRAVEAAKIPAVAVAYELRENHSEAVADSLARGAPFEVFPVASDGKTKWVAGVIFRNQAEASAFQRTRAESRLLTFE
ncbi:MAG: hypothetical protein ACKV2U_30595 [Bryobacteraceae bacterium]